jgi:hypothetical protein
VKEIKQRDILQNGKRFFFHPEYKKNLKTQ